MPHTVLIDTNLLLLLVVGGVRLDQIERFGRTRKYSVADYYLLLDIMDGFTEVIVTPHVLTETSNLLGQLGEPLRGQCLAALGCLVSDWDERWTAASDLVREAVYTRLGLTDSAVLQEADTNTTILTDDLDLYLAVSAVKRTSINFTHLRAERGLL